jgi:hypothetical protein
MKKKIKLVFTFGVGTKNTGKAVIINCNEVMTAITYMFSKYCQLDIAREYHFNEESLKNGCAWQDGLFEEIKDTYDYGKDLIQKYNYEILEEITLED